MSSANDRAAGDITDPVDLHRAAERVTLIIFHLDQDRFALPSQRVREILPAVSIQSLPKAQLRRQCLRLKSTGRASRNTSRPLERRKTARRPTNFR